MPYDLPPVTRVLLIANVAIFLLELVPSLHPLLIAYGALWPVGPSQLAALVVGEAAQGSGAGAVLLAAVEAWTRAQGFSIVRVRSNVLRGRAHRFYLREGYIEKKRQAVFLKRLQATEPPT